MPKNSPQKPRSSPPATKKEMKRLTTTLAQQFTESAKLEKEIRKNLASLGFPLEDKS